MAVANSRYAGFMAALVAVAAFGACAAEAQSGLPNLDELLPMEEALAMEVGDVTLTLNGMIEARYTSGSDDDDANGEGLISSLEATAMTQLPNRWRVRLGYSGQYVTDESLGPDQDGKFSDDMFLSVGGIWGELLLGNVSDTVRNQTRRRQGFGNASLAFEDFHGKPTEKSAGYVGRFGPLVASGVVDDDSNIDLGLSFQRPIGNGNRDYRFTLRSSQGAYSAQDDSIRFTSRGVGVVAEVIYGSTTIDVGLGHERFSSPGLKVTRWYVSAGIQRKITVFGLSLEGHYGRIEGQEEVSAALGIQYDLARGLSANFGLNHEDATVMVGDTLFLDSRDTTSVFSLKYSF